MIKWAIQIFRNENSRKKKILICKNTKTLTCHVSKLSLTLLLTSFYVFRDCIMHICPT